MELLTMPQPQTVDLDARTTREKLAYETGLKRSRYNAVLGFDYAAQFNRRRQLEIINRLLRTHDPKRCLEIGSLSWRRLIEPTGFVPPELHCINLSEKELERSREAARASAFAPEFHLMDAHTLAFDDDSFDFVYGTAILHHLDLPVAYAEIKRVLKPDGMILFVEPLNINPIARVVRRLTPKARTPDEKPFGRTELDLTARHFRCEFDFQEMMVIPCSMVAQWLFADPENAIMRFGFGLDQALKRYLPWTGPYFRSVTIIGRN
jgi:SAM-dependent methyltransferase